MTNLIKVAGEEYQLNYMTVEELKELLDNCGWLEEKYPEKYNGLTKIVEYWISQN